MVVYPGTRSSCPATTGQLFVEIELDSARRVLGVLDCFHDDHPSGHPLSVLPGIALLLTFTIMMLLLVFRLLKSVCSPESKWISIISFDPFFQLFWILYRLGDCGWGKDGLEELARPCPT
jgi:hypothetical protein